MPPRYLQWVAHVFEQPASNPAWFYLPDAPSFEASSAELVELVAHTFENSSALLQFSDAQLSDGFSYMLDNSCSDTVFALMDDCVSLQQRKRAIAAIKYVYADCFEQRCSPVLGHLDEPGANALNQICYMLWDVSPLTYWERKPHQEEFYASIVDVLTFALRCKNIACIESAIHGLGHLHHYAPSASKTLLAFLSENPRFDARLKRYAENAAQGCVQ